MHDSALRFDQLVVGYFGLCWLLNIRCFYPCGLPMPRGISHTSFLVYLPNLRIKVTVAFGNFTVFGQLVRLIRLNIRFLFVRPRFHYCFFSPERHHSKLASRFGVRRQLRPTWTFTTDVWHARHTNIGSVPLVHSLNFRVSGVGLTMCQKSFFYVSGVGFKCVGHVSYSCRKLNSHWY